MAASRTSCYQDSITVLDKPVSVHRLLIEISITNQLPVLFNIKLVSCRFGSRYRSNVTGIIYNDEMDDFDIPGHNIVGDISPSPFPEPNKRPFSSISPAILTNENGRVQLVIGASGGKRITTAVSLVCLMTSYFKQEKMKGTRVHLPHWTSKVYHSRVVFGSIQTFEIQGESRDN